MKRRIIKQGHNTLTVTLPSKWVQKLNLSSKDEVDISEKQNKLVISAQENMKEKSALIDITDFNVPLIWRYFQGAYRSGADEIKVIFEPTKNYPDPFHFYTTHYDYASLGEKVPPKKGLSMIQTVVDRFLNVAIIRTGKNYCIIKEMGEPTTREFDSSLRRVFMIILQMFDRMIEVIKDRETGTVDICKEFHTMDLNIDRFVDYCCRIINKIETSFPEHQKPLLFSTLYLLELVGDEFKSVGKHLAETKEELTQTLSQIEDVKKHFQIYYELFYKFSREKSIEFGNHDNELYRRHFMKKAELSPVGRSIARHFMLMSKLTLSLAEIRIQMEYD